MPSIPVHPHPGHDEWTPSLAERRAAALGLAPLGERHWRLLAASREETARTGVLPDLLDLARLTALSRAEIERLFGPEPLAAIAAIAGLAGLAGLAAPAPSPAPSPTSRTRPSPRRFPSKEEDPHVG